MSKPKPPGPPAPAPKLGSTPAKPNWSYRAFLSWSERISYASLTSLNLASADLSSGFMSGWYFLASLRYAFLISSSEALLLSPSTS